MLRRKKKQWDQLQEKRKHKCLTPTKVSLKTTLIGKFNEEEMKQYVWKLYCMIVTGMTL